MLSASRLLWTDDNSPRVVYIRNANESEFPVWFAEALVSRLTTLLCLPVTGDNSRLGLLQTISHRDVARAMGVNDAQMPPRMFDAMRTYRESLPDRFL